MKEIRVGSLPDDRLKKVVELHQKTLAGLPDHYWCENCRVDWPCKTVRLLDGEEP